MKRLVTSLAVLGLFIVSTSAVAPTKPAVKPNPKAADVFIPLGPSGEMISLLDLSTIRIREVEEMSGRKMSFGDRMKFKVAQKQLRNNIAPDGGLSKGKR